MNYHIVVLDGHTLNPGDLDWGPLREFGTYEVYPRSTEEEGLKRAKKADIIVVNKFPVTGQFLKKLPELKYIVVSATGYNNIDLAKAGELNIPVSNVRAYSAPSVAQHVFAVLLSYLHSPYMYHNELRKGAWSRHADWSYWHTPIMELKGKVMGIYGFGKIGQQVAKIAHSFDMHVIVYTRSPGKNSPGLDFVSLNELFARADIVSLHAAQTEENFEIVSKEVLQLMKTSSILINTARGTLIKENDLFHALKSHSIVAAFLDVLQEEPPPEDHPFYELEHCFLTPHLAWGSMESRQRLLDGVMQNIESFSKGILINKVI